MIEIKRILCPTDFSDFSERALDYALALAESYESEISVVHVVPKVLMAPEVYPYLQDPIYPDARVREQALEELGKFVHRARIAGVTTEIRLEEGDAVQEILRLTSSLRSDLVVMGTHGRRGFDRLVLGSVTEKVLRKSPRPVMTVSHLPEVAKVGQKVSFKRILCPIDFSPCSVRALEYALSLAQETDGQLILLHVVESILDEAGDIAPGGLSDYRAQLERDARDRLRLSVPEQARDWCRPEEIVVSGRTYRQILKLVDEKEADLIVMGVQGRSAVDLLVFGSTANHVVREARVPVLTIRSG